MFEKYRMSKTAYLLYLSLKIDRDHWKIVDYTFINEMNNIKIKTWGDIAFINLLQINGIDVKCALNVYAEIKILKELKKIRDYDANNVDIKVSLLNPEEFI